MSRPLSQIDDDLRRRSREIERAYNDRIPRLVAAEYRDGFRESFALQRFNDDGTAAWPQVKRRTIGQRWYGFQYGTNYAVPVDSRGKGKQYGTRGGRTNFSPRATTRAILLGKGSAQLRDGIYIAQARNRLIVIASPHEHAAVHNEGLDSRIFGRKSFKMPQRKFMGNSRAIEREAIDTISTVIDNIMTR